MRYTKTCNNLNGKVQGQEESIESSQRETAYKGKLISLSAETLQASQ